MSLYLRLYLITANTLSGDAAGLENVNAGIINVTQSQITTTAGGTGSSVGILNVAGAHIGLFESIVNANTTGTGGADAVNNAGTIDDHNSHCFENGAPASCTS